MRPSPSAIDQTRSDALLAQILEAIRRNQGSLSFADYMERALYSPALGYYTADRNPFGAGGDFITAPEQSSLFAQCIAKQYVQIAETLPNAALLEIGAGSGQMAADLLIALGKTQALPKHYWILERSPSLRARQRQRLEAQCAAYLDRVQWIDHLPSSGFKGMIVANEVLDAMPVHRFAWLKDQIYELRVVEEKGVLREQAMPFAECHLARLAHTYGWPSPYRSEINLQLHTWMQDLAACLSEGLLLFIDYGFGESEYYHPDRSMGTLMCHYQHYAHTDPFLYPGLQDISAHVDFSALAEAGTHAGLDLLGYTHQAAFLLGCGLGEWTRNPAHTDQAYRLEQQALQQLLSPAEMGELFKVMAFGRGIDKALRGFEWLDRQHRL